VMLSCYVGQYRVDSTMFGKLKVYD
jgi:hypothetical protein